MIRVLVTGAGGAAAVSFIKAVGEQPLDLFAADVDPNAAGLYLVPSDRRLILPRGDHPTFAHRLLSMCRSYRVSVVVPTVDEELEPLSEHRQQFERAGVRLLLATPETLRCLDKWQLVDMCEATVPTPRTALFDDDFDARDWSFPAILKPRRGSGSRGIRLLRSPEELARENRSDAWLIQEYLPGQEYSVDVLATSAGQVVATVPRERMKVDSGVAVASRTVDDEELKSAARAVAEAIGLTYVANIQFRRRADGTPALLEVNPRFPGTMPLTVAAGVNMPQLSLANLLGQPIPEGSGAFRELAVVRYWNECFVEPAEMERVARCGAGDPPTYDCPESAVAV